MVTFQSVFDSFKEKGCTFLVHEEEFNKNKHNTKEKYKYIASCGHEHEVWLHVFRNRGTGIICPNCTINNDAKNKKESAKLDPLRNSNLEYNNLIYFKEINERIFDIKLTREGCLADLALKPKGIKNDLWMMIQVKSIYKPLRGYAFKCSDRYKNCIILCICQSDKRMWGFDGNIMNVQKISIGLNRSKNSDREITIDTMIEKLNTFYETFPKYDFNTINTPISKVQQLEYEYVKYRQQQIKLEFINSDKQGLVYDFIINGYKVQEKVGNIPKNKNGAIFCLYKNNGRINGCREHTSYKKGDCAFYWLNMPNKQHFYIIPEYELIKRNYVNTETKKSIYLNTETNSKPWTTPYLFDYTKPDLDKIKSLFKIKT